MAPDSARPNAYPKRGRYLTLRSFRKSAPAEERLPPSVAAAGRARKAMAWPWLRPAAPAAGSDRRPPSSSSEAAASVRPAAASDAGALPRATPPSTGPPTPLYDEVELSGLTCQMADFLQRLQRKQAGQQKSAAAPADRKTAAPRRPPLSAEVAAAIPRSISSCAGLGFGYGVRGPMSALQRLLRKVLPGGTARYSASVTERPVLEPDSGDFRHHYHHYIHHHHYHYHYDPANPSSEEGGFPLRSRRHSESSDIRSRIPAFICEDDGDEKEDLESTGPLSAFLARRRRNSDSFFSTKAANDSVSCEGKRGTARVRGPADNEDRRWFSRRYNSERYLIKTNAGETLQDDEVEEELWRSAEIKTRRRHSTESWRAGYTPSSAMKAMEEAAMAAKEAGGLQKLSVVKEDAGNAYELKGGATRRRSASFVESCRRAELLNENSRDGSLLRTPSPAARRRWGQARPYRAPREAHCTYSLSGEFPPR